jgi:hypothetical protein
MVVFPVLLAGCGSAQTTTLSEDEYNRLATKAASSDARNFCDDAFPGGSNADDDYISCYYSVLEQRGRYFRGELEGQDGRPPVSELLESSTTPH